MDISVLRESKKELERQLAATLIRFEESTGATVTVVKISAVQNYERLDENEISVKTDRWFKVKVALEI